MNVDKVLDTYNECIDILNENKYRLSKEDYTYFKSELIHTLYCIPHQTQNIICKAMRDIAFIIEYDDDVDYKRR